MIKNARRLDERFFIMIFFINFAGKWPGFNGHNHLFILPNTI